MKNWFIYTKNSILYLNYILIAFSILSRSTLLLPYYSCTHTISWKLIALISCISNIQNNFQNFCLVLRTTVVKDLSVSEKSSITICYIALKVGQHNILMYFFIVRIFHQSGLPNRIFKTWGHRQTTRIYSFQSWFWSGNLVAYSITKLFITILPISFKLIPYLIVSDVGLIIINIMSFIVYLTVIIYTVIVLITAYIIQL